MKLTLVGPGLGLVLRIIAVILAGFALVGPALAQAPLPATLVDAADSGDTAWLLAASGLALLAALPGIALFLAGQVRAGDAISVFMQVGAIAAIVSLLWVMLGYTLAFGDVTSGILGAGNGWMLIAIGNVRGDTLVPESAFVLFRMGFAILAAALMTGAWAGRARFGWVVVFAGLWSLIVFAPIAHWVWGGGWLAAMGAADYAGGLVVHLTAGASALTAAAIMGPGLIKRGPAPSQSPALVLVGAGLVWVGWFGLSGGSALNATDDAASAIVNTHIAASVGVLTWLTIEKFIAGKPSAVGLATGALAGIAAIAPSAGYVSPGAAILIALIVSAACWFGRGLVRNAIGIDDTLGVFAVHGIGGLLGAMLLPLFVGVELGGIGYASGFGMISLLGVQLLAILVVALWSVIGTLIIGFGISMVLPMRVSPEDERAGLDAASHGEPQARAE